VPGILLLRGLTELAGAYGLETRGRPQRLRRLEGMKFRRFLGPAADVELSVRVRASDDSAASFSGTVRTAEGAAVTVRRIEMVPANGE